MENDHNTSGSAVSETEMRDFFSRMVTSVVGLTEQAKQLTELQIQFNNLNTRVEQLSSEAAWLRSQLDSVTKERDSVKTENAKLQNDLNETRQLADSFAKDLDSERSESGRLRAIINNYSIEIRDRDAAIDGLKKSNFEFESRHVITQQTVSDLNTQVANLTDSNNHYQQTIDFISNARRVTDEHNASLTQELSRVNGQLKTLKEQMENFWQAINPPPSPVSQQSNDPFINAN